MNKEFEDRCLRLQQKMELLIPEESSPQIWVTVLCYIISYMCYKEDDSYFAAEKSYELIKRYITQIEEGKKKDSQPEDPVPLA